ncbi:hypothetical protein N9154_03205 [Akkermansiaceae bacterium]|jgi:hypothetical protein|nr:hypothetical protein [Akkermansiaceae bacterium]
MSFFSEITDIERATREERGLLNLLELPSSRRRPRFTCAFEGFQHGGSAGVVDLLEETPKGGASSAVMVSSYAAALQ